VRLSNSQAGLRVNPNSSNRQVLRVHTRDMPLDADVSLDDLADDCEGNMHIIYLYLHLSIFTDDCKGAVHIMCISIYICEYIYTYIHIYDMPLDADVSLNDLADDCEGNIHIISLYLHLYIFTDDCKGAVHIMCILMYIYANIYTYIYIYMTCRWTPTSHWTTSPTTAKVICILYVYIHICISLPTTAKVRCI